jgi:hypothetical protein
MATAGPQPAKRSLEILKEPELQKRPHMTALVENTDTELESDDQPMPCPVPEPHSQHSSAQLRAAASSSPDPLPWAGTKATPRTSIQPSAATAAPSRSHSLGGSLSHYSSPRLRYPDTDPEPPCNATHAHFEQPSSCAILPTRKSITPTIPFHLAVSPIVSQTRRIEHAVSPV